MSEDIGAGRSRFRLPPCPSWDVGGTERWLGAMAEKGLFLKKDGIFAGIAAFERREPGTVKYRLEPAQKRPSLWSDDGGEPDPEQVGLAEAYSWEYVAKRGDFFIYRSADPAARELNTDPEVQALALNAVKKRRRGSVFNSLFYLLIYPALLMRGSLLLTTIALGTWWMALALLFALLMIADELRAFRYLKRLERSLTEEGVCPPDSGRKNGTASYFVRKLVNTVLLVVLACALLRAWGLSVTDETKIPLERYGGTLPFASLRDLAGEGGTEYVRTMTGLSLGIDTVQEKSDPLAPRCVLYNEHANIKGADGARLGGGLYVDYYELRSPRLAERLMKELYRSDRRKKGFEPMEVPPTEADRAEAYHDQLHFPVLLFRKGSVVVRASFAQYQDAEKTLPFEEWAERIVRSVGGPR